MDARSWNRHLVEKEVKCRIDGERDFVFLYNLSAGGCMVERSVRPLLTGDGVELDLCDFATAQGVVVWSVENSAGVRFDTPIHEAVVRHLGFNPPSLSFEEQEPRDRFGRVLPPIGWRDHGRPV